MKKSLIILLVFTFLYKSEQAQTFEWAKRVGRWSFDLGYGIGTDKAGNVYIAGKYEREAYFGGTYVTCAGNHDIYIAKYSPTGVFKWVRTAGGIIGDYAHAIAVDEEGNSYITGEFQQTTYFGSVALKSSGNNDVFIAKYDTNGNLIWVKRICAGKDNDQGLGISLSNGHVYVTGKFESSVGFGLTKFVTAGGRDIFVAKYTTDGVFKWAKQAGGSGDDEGYAISNDPAGNVYVTGYFKNTANFSGTSISSSGGTEIFLAKYDPNGLLIWVKKAGGSGDDYGMGIKVDSLNRVFVTGGFRQNSTFGSFNMNAPQGRADIFVACYDDSGNATWVKKAGGNLNDYGRALALDKFSNIYITGNFGLNATFESTTITGVDSTELYFASYDAEGNFRWVMQAGGEVDAQDPDRFIEMGLSICTDPSGNVLASGTYRSNSTFGSTNLPPWSNHTEVFVTKINPGTSRQSESLYTQITPSEKATYCSGESILLKAIEDAGCTYTWRKDGEIIKDATASSFKANSPGAYEVTIIKDKDTATSSPTVVTETKKVAAIITTQESIFCNEKVAVLTANNGDEYNYKWKKNGLMISGETSSDYEPRSSGEYQVGITNGECSNWSEIKKITFQPCTESVNNLNPTNVLTLDEENDSLLLKVYPNPNDGLFTFEINMKKFEGTEKVKVEVVNAIGQVVYSKFATYDNGNIKERIELASTLPTGMYLLKVSMGDRVQQTRMMLAK